MTCSRDCSRYDSVAIVNNLRHILPNPSILIAPYVQHYFSLRCIMMLRNLPQDSLTNKGKSIFMSMMPKGQKQQRIERDHLISAMMKWNAFMRSSFITCV